MLREISIGYDPVEDRLHLQLRCRDGNTDVNHRLMLTRRLALPFRGGLQDLVRRSAQVPDTLSEPAQRALEAGHHQALLEKTPLHRERRTPVADDEPPPRLVLQAVCGTRRTDHRAVVRFAFKHGEPITITLSDRTLHALTASINDRIRQAGWLPADATRSAAGRETPEAPPGGLH